MTETEEIKAIITFNETVIDTLEKKIKKLEEENEVLLGKLKTLEQHIKLTS